MRAPKLHIEKQLVPCMSNTRWREVWTCMTARKAFFHIRFVDGWQSRLLWRAWQPNMVCDKGIADSCNSGPFTYAEIQWLCFPRQLAQDMNAGLQKAWPAVLEALLADFRQLGKLPISQEADAVWIYGYMPTKEDGAIDWVDAAWF